MGYCDVPCEKMQELLRSASSLVKKRNPLEDINLFSILGMENKEVSAHSAFLFYIFKPFQGEDGKRDDQNLRILYHHLFRKDNGPTFLDIQREVPFDNGRIDFLLKYDSDAAVIELKVWAGEQPDQIQRYRKYLEQNGYSENNVFFLTPNGRTPTTGKATPISLKDDMTAVLKEICEKRASHKHYVTIIEQYITLVGNLTDGRNMMETDALFKSKTDIIASEELYDRRQDVLVELLGRFMDELIEKLITNGELIVSNRGGQPFRRVETGEETTIADYYRRGIRCLPRIAFALDKAVLKNEYKGILKDKQDLYFFVEIDHKLYCGITARENRFDPVELNKKSFKKKKCGKMILFDGAYWSWGYVTYNSHDIDFRNYTYDDGLFSIVKDDSFDFIDGSIDSIANCIVESFKAQYNMFFEPGL